MVKKTPELLVERTTNGGNKSGITSRISTILTARTEEKVEFLRVHDEICD